jgi:phenylacetate-coenzyme A ligase PaaK-like adenylate-forming protein
VIRAGGTRLLFVAFGAPAQELWIARNLPSLGPMTMGLRRRTGAGNPHTRRQLEEAFGCKVYDCMGTADFCTAV